MESCALNELLICNFSLFPFSFFPSFCHTACVIAYGINTGCGVPMLDIWSRVGGGFGGRARISIFFPIVGCRKGKGKEVMTQQYVEQQVVVFP